MEPMMWIFTDLASGDSAVFDDEANARAFVKEYGNYCYDLCDEFPTEAEQDYTLRAVPLNPNFKEWLSENS